MSEQVSGWPLVHKRVYQGFSTGELVISPEYPLGLSKAPPFQTELHRPALLVNLLFTILLSATAGMTCQRWVRLYQSRFRAEGEVGLAT